MKSALKNLARLMAQQTIGRLPPRPSRLTGKLACEGGTPVRDIRIRPWAAYHAHNRWAWTTAVRPQLRSIFLKGAEGTPQRRSIEFAEKWAARCGCRYGLLLPHGTDALRFALAAVFDHDGLEYGGEVIVPNFSFIASAGAPLDRRFGIALVDVEQDTLLLDPKRVEEAIVPGKTRAIMPVHLFGQPADMTALGAVARRHSLKIIEDAAQAHGAEWETGPVGSLGDAAGFSFQSHKSLSCGEGGMLTTNDEEVFERAYRFHDVGRARIGRERWDHHALGWNCRPTEYQAAVLLHRLTLFDEQQSIRRENFRLLRQLLAEVPSVEPLGIRPGVKRHGMYMFPLRYRPEHCGGAPFDDFLRAVQAEGMPINRAFSTTMSAQPAIQRLLEKRPQYVRVLPTPVSDQAAAETAFIPHDVFLGAAADMEEIAAAIRKVARHFCARA
ncbi:MAG TPA: DegT/DnrJ/EryC1/StrS family aminotransferase [Planctomycetaceae bacterium]|nr:DegT/DnrJ/EryC1/StrS family aminotransferase [Planctomycetaceae bacterium]